MKYIFFIGLILFYNFHMYSMIAHTIAEDCSLLAIKYNLHFNDINEPYRCIMPNYCTQYLGLTPLQIACQQEKLDIVSFLLFFPEIRVNNYQPDTNPALHAMIKKYNKNQNTRDITRLLIAYPTIDINLADSIKRTPLHIAVQWNHSDVVNDIITIHHEKVDPNLQDNKGSTPLHIACECNHQKIVKKLLEHPTINLEKKNNIGATPFAIACSKGFMGIAKLLIDKKCNIDSEDNDLNTPLHAACTHNHIPIVSLLIQHNANATVINENKEMAISMACRRDHHTCVELLLKAHPTTYKKEQLLSIAAKNKSTDTIKVLIQHSTPAYFLDKNNETALHISCQNNNFTGVTALLLADTSGINLQRDHFQQTALHIAAENAGPDIAELLLAKGADSTILDANQETSLACFYFKNKTDRIDPVAVQSMVHATDSEKNTQLHLYAKSNLSQYNCQNRINEKNIDSYLSFLLASGLSIWSHNSSAQTAANVAVQDYQATYNFYLEKPTPPMKSILDTQERIMHTFLRITSHHINAILFQKFFKQFQLLPEIKKHIMQYYYKINIETIIARQYNNDPQYYNKTIDQKQNIKKKLIQDLECPRFLWRF